MAIQFFATSDPALLAQYYELRHQTYRRHYPHLPEDFGMAEFLDETSHIVVGYDGHLVAGGRITISRPHQPQRMPMEAGEFQLAQAVSQFALDRKPYGEFSRVTVDPAYAHGRRCGLGLIREMIHTTAALHVDLVFSICPAPQVRWNATNSRKCGVRFHVFPDIAAPDPFGIPMTLCAYTGLIEADHRSLPLSA